MDVLRDVAGEAGLDADAALVAIADGAHTGEVQSWWDQARRSGVRGVPTFIAGGRALAGAQPVEALAKLVDEA